jgi:hypothetical protein
MKKSLSICTLVVIAALTTGCQNKDAGMVGGGVAGGAAGALLTNGSPVGAVVGAVGGAVVGRSMSGN